MKAKKFKNYDNIPANLTGCEKRCYCENGEVLCQDACYEISEEPPGYLSCAKDIAIEETVKTLKTSLGQSNESAENDDSRAEYHTKYGNLI